MMDAVYKKYVQEEFDEKGMLKRFKPVYPDNFNFAFDVVDEIARRAPDKKAMLWLSAQHEERVFTFGDISRMSSRAANWFASLGIARGDRVMLVLRRDYEFWLCITALHKLGAVAIPATDQLKAKDIVYRCEKAGVKAVVCTYFGQTRDTVDAAVQDCHTLKLRIYDGESSPLYNERGWLSLREGCRDMSESFPRPEGQSVSDPMLMYFTSGTTGYPKIAAHDFSYPLGHILTARYWHNVDPEGLHFTVADTGWGKAVWGKLYGQWLCEACVLTYDFERFHADDLLSVMEKYKVTTFCAPPTIYRFMIQEDLSRFDLSSLKYATIAGEALNPEVYYRFLEKTGVKLMEGFGQTETTLTAANIVGMEPKPGSMGKPSPQYTLVLLSDEGKPVSTGETGEICIDTREGKPCGMFMGYYTDPELTQKAWHDGFYHTGDMAWADEDGYMWYVGRGDDLIKSSGYRIGPFEIESVLMEHPSVLECAITAVPDPIRGQAVKATIVLCAGYEGSEDLKKELQNYVKKQTAPYKYPRVVEFVKELPKTISGKIQRAELRRRS